MSRVGKRNGWRGSDLVRCGGKGMFAGIDERRIKNSLWRVAKGLEGLVGQRTGEWIGWASYKVVKDLFPNHLDHLERGERGYRVDEHVAMNADEVLRVQDAVFVLFRNTSCQLRAQRPS